MSPPIKKLGFAGKIAQIFVMNSKLSILLILFLFFSGVFAYFITPKQYNPEIVAPAFNVITQSPGASSFEIEKLITTKLEDKIHDLKGVDGTMSQSLEGGISIITVKFFIGEDLEKSKTQLTEKIFAHLDLLPSSAQTPVIKPISPDDVPIVTLGISSNVFSSSALRQFAFDFQEKIKTIPNTSNFQVTGGEKRELQIILNPEALNAHNISVLQIAQILQANNLKFLGGELEDHQKKYTLEVDGQLQDIQAFQKLVVGSFDQKPVYLEDIANIQDTSVEINSYTKLSKKTNSLQNTVYLSFAKRKGSNAVSIVKDFQNQLKTLEQTFIPEEIQIEVLGDEGRTASEAVNGLTQNLFTSILIVFLVLLFFLGFRSALIVAISIPLTLASVFTIGLLAGETINRITLFALILSLGMLVDSATVVVENAYRYIQKNPQVSRKMAVIYAVDEVGMGLFMSTITTVLAFYPMAFVTGMMGPYMGPIPFFVPVALITSLLIAYTINPYLASVLITRNQKPKKDATSRFLVKYRNFLHHLLNHKKARNLTLLITLAVFFVVISFPVFQLVKFRMLPKADKEQFYLYLDTPDGTQVEETHRLAQIGEKFLLQNPNVVSIQSFIGIAPVLDFNGLFKGSESRFQSNQATLKINLLHPNERKIESDKIVLSLRPELEKLFIAEPQVKLKLIEDPPGPPVLSTLLAKIQGDNLEELKKIAFDLEASFALTTEVVDIDHTINENKLKYSFEVNHTKASLSGISAEQIAYTLRTAIQGAEIGFLHGQDSAEAISILMRFDQKYRQNLENLEQIFLTNPQGHQIPLSELVVKQNKNAEEVIYHDNRKQTIYLYAEMGNRSVTYATLDIFKFLLNYKLPSGLGQINGWSPLGVNYFDPTTNNNYRIEWGGEWELTVKVFRDLGTAMAVAIFLIYLVLVAQFHSFRSPLIIMGTIPLAMIGVMPGFALLEATRGLYFNATSMIGVIALSGIVVNNAIILLEYLNALREKGYTAHMALLEAGQTRMRPILLTSATTVLGSLTIINDPVWAGLAWAIIWGLSLSAGLTLVIFPLLYDIIEGKNWITNEYTSLQNHTEIESHGPSLQ